MHQPRAIVSVTKPEDWTYVSEGGATIVFSYTGSQSHFVGKVLRLRKVPNSGATHNRNTDEEEPDDPMIAFQNTIISHLVPKKYLPEMEVVLLDTHWLERLQEVHDDDRPPARREKDKIDTGRSKGILATDLIGGANTLAVEIKPKWGFMPSPTHLSQDTAPVKTSTCRFCMHTRLRSPGGDVPTQYCPMDLYSGDEARIRKAIRDLWNAWVHSNGSLNNLRVFASGKMVKPSDSNDALKRLLPGHAELEEVFAAALLPYLQTPALAIISQLQRTLDALDVEGFNKLNAVVTLGVENNGSESVTLKPTLEDWQNFVASYRSEFCEWDHSKPDPANINAYLMAYLLSGTFKDCSLILRIKQEESGQSPYDAPHAVSIIDLDPKDTERLGGWADIDRRIVLNYKDIDAAQRKLCRDQHLHLDF
ncbi:hypothetical protein HYDPIDRAFT_81118 [Hydnomerulius pinastri MD-312]|nr:hypothetical protein HYDPIDRAFT_81118 [Hydnomerulius pinastri MD-312]